MKHSVKNLAKLKKSIDEHTLTIYTGIHTNNKTDIINNLVQELKAKKEVIILNFSIMNLNRKYESSANIAYLKEKIKPNSETVIFIFEFTNCEE